MTKKRSGQPGKDSLYLELQKVFLGLHQVKALINHKVHNLGHSVESIVSVLKSYKYKKSRMF